MKLTEAELKTFKRSQSIRKGKRKAAIALDAAIQQAVERERN